jgi:hypothetical protein
MSLGEETDKVGLEINKKTKFMIVSRKPYTENECVKLGTYQLK